MPEFFNRPPRLQPQLPVQEFQIPTPPSPSSSTRQSLLQIGVPLVTIAGYILVSGSGHGSNPLFVLPMALAVLASTTVSLTNFRRTSREEAAKQAAYRQRLAQMRSELIQYHDEQRAFYLYTNPDTTAPTHMPGEDHQSR